MSFLLWLLLSYLGNLTDNDQALPAWLICSQGRQIRLRGSRNVPRQEEPAVVTNGVFESVAWPDHQAEDFFGALRSQATYDGHVP